jgi:putative SOS response-associated peptidase YedK
MRVRKDQKPFTMAGLWDLWRDPNGSELRGNSDAQLYFRQRFSA